MLFPGQFPRNTMRPPRHRLGNLNRPFNQPNRGALGNLFSSRQTNQLPLNPLPFSSQSQNSLTSIASKGVGGLSKTLENVQQVLRVIESATPIVQQYGPMIKNLPAMYRMMKAFKDINLEEEDDTVESKNDDDLQFDFEEFEESEEYEGSPNDVISSDDHVEDRRYRSQKGQSIPKLFI